MRIHEFQLYKFAYFYYFIHITLIINSHEKWLKALILFSIRSPILFSNPSQMLFCFSIATIRSSLCMQDLSTYLLISYGFLFETMVTRERVNN